MLFGLVNLMFKNAIFFRMVADYPKNIHDFIALAEAHPFDLKAPSRRIGCDYTFYPKIGKKAFYTDSCIFMTFIFVERKVPGKLLKKLVNEQIRVKENEIGKELSNRDKSEIKEMFVSQLSAKTLPNIKEVNVYFDLEKALFVADCSYNTAQEIISLIRIHFGTFKVEAALDEERVHRKITEWFRSSNVPSNIQLGFKAKLKGTDSDGATASFSNHLLTQAEIQTHLTDKSLKQIELVFDSVLSLVVKDDGTFASIKTTNEFNTKMTDFNEDYVSYLEAEFMLMRRSFLSLLNLLT